MKENILGYDVNTFSVDVCADRIFQSLRESKRTWLACFNPHSYAMTLKDNVFARALKDADLLVPDGAGVVLASHFLGGAIQDRVTGSDVFAGLHKRMNAAGSMRVFFSVQRKKLLNLLSRKWRLIIPISRLRVCFRRHSRMCIHVLKSMR
jgi:N-acetylglucosaminyldiphosphoundecaprenol N-acetyl-beta-D-mannosaminyltransferase